MHALERIPATRIVATPAALDALHLPAHHVLRTARDEAIVIPPVPGLAVSDPHAIIVDEGGYAGIWLDAAQAQALLERACEWKLPTARPAFAQGAVAGIAAKLVFEADRVLIVIPAPMMHDFADALSTVGLS